MKNDRHKHTSQEASLHRQSPQKPLQDADVQPELPDAAAAVQRALAKPLRALRNSDLLALQRSSGNRAVQRLVAAQPRRPTTIPAAQDILQRQAEADAHQAGCGCSGCGSIQRTSAPNGFIQREILKDWRTESTVKGPFGIKKIRSKELKSIDGAVALYNSKAVGERTDRLTALDAILNAIGTWETNAGKKDPARVAKVTELKQEAQKQKLAITSQLAQQALDLQAAQLSHDRFHTMDADLAPYAKRSKVDYKVDRFKPSTIGAVSKALTLPRGPNDALTDEGITAMDTADAAPAIVKEQAYEAKSGVDTGGLSPDELIAFMANNTNELTGKTNFPELKNLTQPLDPLTNPDEVTTDAINVGGVTMQVEHNKSDVNYSERLKLVSDAVAKIAGAGLTVPSLLIHFPKYGRNIKLQAAQGSGQPGCEVNDKSSRAVFIAPNFMHLSSEIIGTPDLSEVTNPVTGAKEYKFSSTGFDPSGVATIVHEFGHALHYAQAPGKFHGLFGTGFATPEQTTIASSEVSQYGNKPREFVAEVFLGLIYGKNYSDEVLKMYKAFGGVIPPSLAGRFATL